MMPPPRQTEPLAAQVLTAGVTAIHWRVQSCPQPVGFGPGPRRHCRINRLDSFTDKHKCGNTVCVGITSGGFNRVKGIRRSPGDSARGGFVLAAASETAATLPRT